MRINQPTNKGTNILEPAADQSDGAPSAGLRCDLPAVDKAVPLTLS